MKNYLKTGILLLGISLLLWNCEKDTTNVIESQSIEINNSLSQDDISIESFDFEKFKEFPLYSQLDNFVKFNAKSRTSKKKEHKFKIHKNTFKKITKKDIDYTSYTFLISDTENFEYTTVQNLVINQYKKNIEVFIFTYNSFDISDEHKYNINENVVVEQLFDFDISELGDLASKDGILIDGSGDGSGDGEPSSGGGSSTYCYNVSIIIDYPCYGSGSLGTNHANCQCGTSVAPNCTQPHQEYYSETFCTTEFDSSTTAGSYYISNNYSPTGGGSGTPNVTTSDNNIIISSIIKNEIPEGADPIAFRLNLDSNSASYNWLVNPINVNEYNQIGLFLEEYGVDNLETHNFAIEAIYVLINGVEVDSGISDFVDEEPVQAYLGTVSNFKNLLDNSPRGVGKFKGNEASNYLRSLGETKFNFKQMRPLPTQTGFFNTKKGRYIYTKKGGWIDMAHFMFYAGKAYAYKLDGDSNPIGEAVQDGYKQEASDSIVAEHSAYSYEDLHSDKFGAEFAVNYFDPSINLTFGEQLANYLNNILMAAEPNNAPNYNDIPIQDSRNAPTITNRTTTPIFTQ